MFKSIATFILALVFILAGITPSEASTSNPGNLPTCSVEDGSYGENPCYFPSTNGLSFSIYGDRFVYDEGQDMTPLYEAGMLQDETGNWVEGDAYWTNIIATKPEVAAILTPQPVVVAPAPVQPSATITTPATVAPVSVAPATAYDTTAATAWALFDAVSASDLLPATASTVTFAATASTPFPTTADTITVWDNHGHHYLFTIS